MDESYSGLMMKAAIDDTYYIKPLNDINSDTVVELTTIGVVDIDTSIMPDVFGLRAFDSGEPVVWVLPGAFGNTVRVLVPDDTAASIGFHDVILENLTNIPDYRARLISPRDITSLRRQWSSSLFADMHKRQADMETMRRDCKWEFDSEFGGAKAGTCPRCGVHVMFNLS